MSTDCQNSDTCNSLPEMSIYIFLGPNQIDTFLEEHRGDGIQHIGLHTESIVNAVSTLQEQGVNFVEPPYTYYTEVRFCLSLKLDFFILGNRREQI